MKSVGMASEAMRSVTSNADAARNMGERGAIGRRRYAMPDLIGPQTLRCRLERGRDKRRPALFQPLDRTTGALENRRPAFRQRVEDGRACLVEAVRDDQSADTFWVSERKLQRDHAPSERPTRSTGPASR